MFPIRCLIEAVDDDRCPKCSDSGSLVVSDSYAIVAGQTPLSQLVDTVLAALGLQHLGYGCKPMLQLKNWKPLTFDQISDEPDVEVETILKDVSNQLTLRILTKQSSTALQGSVNDLKDRLLRAILQKVPDLLSESQRTQWKEFLAQLALATSNPATVAQMNLTDLILSQKSNNSNNNNTWLDDWSKRLINHQGIVPSALTENDVYSLTSSNKNSTNSDPAPRPTPTTNDQQSAAPAITRFSPLLEIPKLEHWFRENANPSRQRLQQYVNILNASNFRKHTSKVTYQQICNWFINARATSRRRASRMVGQQQQRVAAQQGSTPQVADSGSQATTNGWPQKVFGSQVRNLSLAFNNFINQCSSPASPSANYHHNQNTSQNVGHVISTDSSTPMNNSGAKAQLRTPQDDFDHQVEDDDQGQDEDDDENGDNAINLSKNVVEEKQQQNKSSSDSTKSKSPIVGAPAAFVNGGTEDDESKHVPKISCIPMKNGSLAEILVNGSHSDEQNSCSPNSLGNENPTMVTTTTDLQRNGGSTPSAHGDSIFPGFTPGKTSPLNPVAAAHHYQHFASSQQQGNAETPFQQQQVNANRSRLMFDPLSELPMLEKWFEENPHPSWVQINQITETLNNMPYRHTYPRVSSHNVKIWFKNRRAKSKRHLIASDAVKNEVDQKMYFS